MFETKCTPVDAPRELRPGETGETSLTIRHFGSGRIHVEPLPAAAARRRPAGSMGGLDPPRPRGAAGRPGPPGEQHPVRRPDFAYGDAPTGLSDDPPRIGLGNRQRFAVAGVLRVARRDEFDD